MKKAIVLVLCVIMVVSLAACGDKGSTLEQAIERGYVTVGFANEKPYAYKEASGELTGEAVEIARVILERLGIKEMRGELTEFGSLVAGLQAERFDMITAGMFINPERCSAVLFADPEYSIGEALAVKKGNPLGLGSYADVANDDNAKVAVMTGAVEIGYMEKSGIPSERIIQVPDQASAISALQADRVQAITMTGPSLQAMLDSASDESIERVTDFEQPVIDGESVRSYGATAFRKADTEFQQAYNTELQKMKESGELLEILQQFGFTEEELPGDMTAAALCGK
ncbi:ectoine/hydroxyectoine ABC transporter substrate-binding protein EhuB [Paenibacillus faecalis]|uniref:ectoine/hydroxyectoine ABC transporter substrate-binding protein EhuB n=1 Tax=Paenibacillus faecalis TaxID=2079532 RepID=UPI000D11118D|nr:ectoine/hydroxyectoine ABC transporter substrate-binding protein EhuB [Paenibacillus faecalis]